MLSGAILDVSVRAEISPEAESCRCVAVCCHLHLWDAQLASLRRARRHADRKTKHTCACCRGIVSLVQDDSRSWTVHRSTNTKSDMPKARPELTPARPHAQTFAGLGTGVVSEVLTWTPKLCKHHGPQPQTRAQKAII